jgi:hypothetical protein
VSSISFSQCEKLAFVDARQTYATWNPLNQASANQAVERLADGHCLRVIPGAADIVFPEDNRPRPGPSHKNATTGLETEETDKDFPGKYLAALLLGQRKDAALEFAQTFVFYKLQISHCLIALKPFAPQRRRLAYGRGLVVILGLPFLIFPPS